MNKILLVYEDYADLMSVQAALKKVGFDVIGLSSEYAVSEKVLAFNPDLVVGAGGGGKVNSVGVGKRLKDMNRWQGRSILIFPQSHKPGSEDLLRIRVDMALEAPVPIFRLIQVVGKLLGYDEVMLMERFNKVGPVDSTAKSTTTSISGPKFFTDKESIVIRGSVPPEGETDSRRVDKTTEKSQSFPLNTEDQEEKTKVSFHFDDGVPFPEKENKLVEKVPASGFADVDLKVLERELLGGGVPEVERVEVPMPGSAEDDELADLRAKVQSALKKSAKSSDARMAKYKKIVADAKAEPQSTVSRVEARRRQNQLAAEWDSKSLKEIDSLRREFAKALFKK